MILLDHLIENNITEWKDVSGKDMRIVSTNYSPSHPILAVYLDSAEEAPILYMFTENGNVYGKGWNTSARNLAPIPPKQKIVWIIEVSIVDDTGSPFYTTFADYQHAISIADLYRERTSHVKMYKTVIQEDTEVPIPKRSPYEHT